MSVYSLTQLQYQLLEMLRWFQDFCEKNKLRYYVLGGTMLGAIRHKGFIPWDDDIDVGMPRGDYQKLIRLMSKKESGRYIIETPYSTALDFCYPYSKIYNTATTLVENYHKPLVRGIFIDVFPLDGMGNNEKDALMNYTYIRRMYNFYLSRVVTYRPERSAYKNVIAFTSKLIPEFIINNRNLRIKLDQECKKKNFDDCNWGGNVFGNWGFNEIMPNAVMGKPVKYSFENIEVYGAEDYDQYLKNLYGDWRKMPPKEKQISHHDYLKLDLETSFGMQK